jgi:hypothetical protein
MRRTLSTICLVLVLVACATSPEMRAFQGLAVSGEMLDDAGRHMLNVNKIYTDRCKDRTLSASQCNSFIDFAEKFKKFYRPAVDAWKASRTITDAALQKQTDTLVRTLISELIGFGTKVGYQVLFK